MHALNKSGFSPPLVCTRKRSACKSPSGKNGWVSPPPPLRFPLCCLGAWPIQRCFELALVARCFIIRAVRGSGACRLPWWSLFVCCPSFVIVSMSFVCRPRACSLYPPCLLQAFAVSHCPRIAPCVSAALVPACLRSECGVWLFCLTNGRPL
jgi:hypothetical protein